MSGWTFSSKNVRYDIPDSGNKTKTMPWRVQSLKGAMEAYMGGAVVWLPPHAMVIEIPGNRVEGGYVKIRPVRFWRIENIPGDIDFAGKMPKATNDFAKGMNGHWRPWLVQSRIQV
jgi:hypothetical protein